RRERLHRLGRHHDVGETPPLAALQKLLTQFVLGSDQDDPTLERVLTREAEHGCGACGSAGAGDDSGGEGHDLELDRTEAVAGSLAHPCQAAIEMIEGGLARQVATFLTHSQAGVHAHGVRLLGCNREDPPTSAAHDDARWRSRTRITM